MASPPSTHLANIERKMKNMEQLLLEILKQQRQAEQLVLLADILSSIKAQSLKSYHQKEWLESHEVLSTFQISRSTLFRWKREGTIKPRRLGKRDFYLRRDLERLFKTE